MYGTSASRNTPRSQRRPRAAAAAADNFAKCASIEHGTSTARQESAAIGDSTAISPKSRDSLLPAGVSEIGPTPYNREVLPNRKVRRRTPSLAACRRHVCRSTAARKSSLRDARRRNSSATTNTSTSRSNPPAGLVKVGRRDDRALDDRRRHARLPARGGRRRALARARRIQRRGPARCCSSLLVGGLGFYAVRRLWPLCVGSINPAYAAQAIEHDNPSLKNSLLEPAPVPAAPRRGHRRRLRNARRASGQAAHSRAGRFGRRSHAAACGSATC